MAMSPTFPPTVASRITWWTCCSVTCNCTFCHSSPWFPCLCHTCGKYKRVIWSWRMQGKYCSTVVHIKYCAPCILKYDTIASFCKQLFCNVVKNLYLLLGAHIIGGSLYRIKGPACVEANFYLFIYLLYYYTIIIIIIVLWVCTFSNVFMDNTLAFYVRFYSHKSNQILHTRPLKLTGNLWYAFTTTTLNNLLFYTYVTIVLIQGSAVCRNILKKPTLAPNMWRQNVKQYPYSPAGGSIGDFSCALSFTRLGEELSI